MGEEGHRRGLAKKEWARIRAREWKRGSMKSGLLFPLFAPFVSNLFPLPTRVGRLRFLSVSGIVSAGFLFPLPISKNEKRCLLEMVAAGRGVSAKTAVADHSAS